MSFIDTECLGVILTGFAKKEINKKSSGMTIFMAKSMTFVGLQFQKTDIEIFVPLLGGRLNEDICSKT